MENEKRSKNLVGKLWDMKVGDGSWVLVKRCQLVERVTMREVVERAFDSHAMEVLGEGVGGVVVGAVVKPARAVERGEPRVVRGPEYSQED